MNWPKVGPTPDEARPLNEKQVRAALAALGHELHIARVHTADYAFRSLRWADDL